jgi:O-antigen/teichoic acid export membrane protein
LLWLGYGAFGLMGGFASATLLTAILVFVLVGTRPQLPDGQTVRRTYEFARWSVPNSLVNNVYARADVLLLGIILGSGAVGLYESALRVTLPATFVAISISDSLTVKASGLSSLGEDVEDDLRNAVSYAGLLSIPLVAGTLALPGDIVLTYLLREDFVAAWPAVIGLAVFQVFNSYRLPFDAVVAGIDRPELQFRVNLLTAVIHIPMAVILTYVYGFLGVVVATIVAECLRVVVYQYVAYRIFGRPVVTRPIAAQIGSAVAMFVGVKGLSVALAPVTGLVEVGALIGSGVVLYFAVLFVVSGHFREATWNVATAAFPGSVPIQR